MAGATNLSVSNCFFHWRASNGPGASRRAGVVEKLAAKALPGLMLDAVGSDCALLQELTRQERGRSKSKNLCDSEAIAWAVSEEGAGLRHVVVWL